MTSSVSETVMINVEDFTESFLTCGTCLSRFDAADRSPKLLPCSHTLCRTCLNRIIETSASAAVNTDTAGSGGGAVPAITCFRCPICREGITIPTGDASAFPPAFIVNQLLDLLANQRRERVPRCHHHPGQELLFCETCETIVCAACGGGGPCVGKANKVNESQGPTASNLPEVTGVHTLITLNVAMKRCSEMGLYKAQICQQKLDTAFQEVRNELQRLDDNMGVCIAMINKSFDSVQQVVDRYRQEMLEKAQAICKEKQRGLTDQFALIEAERAAVQHQCDLLNCQSDVRGVTKAVSYLNDRLDQVITLMHPKENAYIRFQEHLEGVPQDMSCILEGLGEIITSTTHPPLCTANLTPMTVHLNSEITVHAVDVHGQPQTAIIDPISVELCCSDISDPEGPLHLPVDVSSTGDGSFRLRTRPRLSGRHTLAITLLDRHIRGSPFTIEVAGHQTPAWTCNKGKNGKGLVQPFSVVCCSGRSSGSSAVLVLDTGNSRIVGVDSVSGEAFADLGTEAMIGQGGTGVCCEPGQELGHRVWIINWRKKTLFLLDVNTDQIAQTISSPQLQEPTSLAVSPSSGEILVVDRGAGKIWALDPRLCTSPQETKLRTVCSDSSIKHSTGICENATGELVLAGNGIKVFTKDYKSHQSLWPGSRSQFGGVVCVPGPNPLLLSTRTERSKCVVQVFEPDLLLDSPGDQPPTNNNLPATSLMSLRNLDGYDKPPRTHWTASQSTLTSISSGSTVRTWEEAGCSYEMTFGSLLKRAAGLCLVPESQSFRERRFAVVDTGTNSVHMMRYM